MDYPKTRKEAKASGSAMYFTGVPCKRGHVAPRETKGNCSECRKEDTRASAGTRKAYFDNWNKSEAGQRAKAAYYEKNKELVKARANLCDVEARRQYRRTYKERNPDATLLDTNTYKRRLRACTPPWLTKEQRAEIRDIYRMALQLTKTTGVRYTVDHEIPIRSKTVCGLHVPWNLVVIPHVDNARKGNRY